MEQRISLVTLGVTDVARAKAFYEQLGWQGQEVEETVFFRPAAWPSSSGVATSWPTTPASTTRAPAQ